MISLRRQIRREKDKLKGVSGIQSQDRDFYRNMFENNFLRGCAKRIKEEESARKSVTVRPMKSNKISSKKSLSKGLVHGYLHPRVVSKRTHKPLAPTATEKTFSRLVSKLLPEVSVVLAPILTMDNPPPRPLPLREKVTNL